MTTSTNIQKTLIIGDPVAHSLSPVVHNAGYSVLNLPMRMERLRVTPEQLSTVFSELRAGEVAGLAITMPLKVHSLTLADTTSEAARTIGAINTVYRSSSGELVGDNTDWIGIRQPLTARRTLQHTRVAIIGAGGAALAAIYACTKEGATVTIFNRSEEKARDIGARLGASVRPLSDLSSLTDFDVIINATPIGMNTDDAQVSPFQSITFTPQQLLFETVYSPLLTPFIRQGRTCGAETVTGDQMFLEQALAQFRLHTSQEAPRAIMAEALHNALHDL